MLDLKILSDNLKEIEDKLKTKSFENKELFSRLSEALETRKQAISETQTLQAKRNAESKEMAAIADKKSVEFQEKRASLKALSDRVKELEKSSKSAKAEVESILAELPNLPAEDAPIGGSEDDNIELRKWGKKPSFSFQPKDHVDLGESLGILDFERSTKISGARFSVLVGAAAQLERALISFMLDLHTEKHGYTEVWVPAIVKDSALFGTSQLPKFAQDSFKIEKDRDWEKESASTGYDLYLIPTAEVPVTNLHADEILSLQDLPLAYCAHTPCFRSEAGSYGRDTRGLIRQHQFDKVELVRFATPENAQAQHKELVKHAEAVLQELELHYRVMDLCTSDMSFAAKRCYDIEVWLPGQGAYREISSCSWFGDFQARRMNARFRREERGKPEYLHTINGSGLAVGRTLIAIMEQYQTKEGFIRIPDALVPYMRGQQAIKPGQD